MANISRPFQIAFLGIVVLAGVWLFALHGGSSSTPSSSASSASAPVSAPASAPHASASSAPSASTSAPAAGKGSSSSGSVYHGSAPGVEGLSRAVAKAKGAVATSQQNAQRLEAKSAQASESGSAPAATAAPKASASAPATAQSAPTHSASPAKPATTATPTEATKTKTVTKTTVEATAGRQHQVEAQIAKGKVVLILFWNKQGSDDRAAKAAVESFAHGHAGTAVMTASSGEVAAFGTITRGVQVFGTPTIFVVGKSGKAIVLTGLTDSFALSQAIAQARHSS